MGDDFDLRRYFLDIADPEERARTIHESGWAGDPDIEDIEVPVARLGGGKYQNAGFISEAAAADTEAGAPGSRADSPGASALVRPAPA